MYSGAVAGATWRYCYTPGMSLSMSSAPASVDAIRAQFPALRRRQGADAIAYFDGPGGTQVPSTVVEAMSEYLLHHNANTHWHYPTSIETDAALVRAREALADLLNGSPDEIVFGANMTTLTFHVARALGRGWGPGDEVVITDLDHHANVAPWRAIERERGITVRSIPFDVSTGTLDWVALERVITPRTKLLAIGAASNALGTISDVGSAARLAHAAGALVFVDAVHYAPHALVDVRELDCDFLACSAYKFYGPHVGVLYGRQALLETLDVPKLAPAPDTAPERLETGTQNHEGIVGAAAAVDFLAAIGAGSVAGSGFSATNDRAGRRAALASAALALHARGHALVSRLWEGLGSIPGVSLYGPPPSHPRTPTVSFSVADRTSDEVARELASRGLFLSHGDFYAATVMERLGRASDGVVRAGCACYTSGDEVERLVAAVRAIAT
jgi:cysteine desulfurase family protein (TIGR01976 family)